MGAGKGYTMKWLSRHGFFPLENIVHIDMDMFRQSMPEWRMYVDKQDKSTPEREEETNAGHKTQNEAGFIQVCNDITQQCCISSASDECRRQEMIATRS